MQWMLIFIVLDKQSAGYCTLFSHCMVNQICNFDALNLSPKITGVMRELCTCGIMIVNCIAQYKKANKAKDEKLTENLASTCFTILI